MNLAGELPRHIYNNNNCNVRKSLQHDHGWLLEIMCQTSINRSKPYLSASDANIAAKLEATFALLITTCVPHLVHFDFVHYKGLVMPGDQREKNRCMPYQNIQLLLTRINIDNSQREEGDRGSAIITTIISIN